MSTVERDYRVVDDLPTIKDRNRVVRELEAEGFNVKAGGTKRYGYKVTGWKGERPYVVRQTFGIGTGEHSITPLYRRGDEGFELEFMDGTPEGEED